MSLPTLVLTLATLTPPVGPGDPPSTPDLGAITDPKSWTLYATTAESVTADGRKAARLRAAGDSADGAVGLAVAVGTAFTTGTLTVELKGKNVKQGSFLGVAFNVIDAKTFEAVYFRPFNFRADGAFNTRAVQYLAWPEHTWQKLRADHPGKFEGPVRPTPDPDGWFRARVEVAAKTVTVYVNDGTTPTLVVERLAAGQRPQPVGLFVDVADALYSDLRVTASR